MEDISVAAAMVGFFRIAAMRTVPVLGLFCYPSALGWAAS